MAEAVPSSEPERRQGKSATAFRTISEVAKRLDVPPHVLRFWESKFTQIKPLKRGGGRRYYRPEDIDLLRGIRELLYTEGYTIKGVQKLLREGGIKNLVAGGPAAGAPEPGEAKAVGGAPSDKGVDQSELLEVLAELESLREILRDPGG